MEYGFHDFFQTPLGHPHLLSEVIAGVTWPKEAAALPRERSLLAGLRTELGFGSH
ncbi:MAG: hypothetical protein WD960_04290 [Gemmatimonadota bacterium]